MPTAIPHAIGASSAQLWTLSPEADGYCVFRYEERRSDIIRRGVLVNAEQGHPELFVHPCELEIVQYLGANDRGPRILDETVKSSYGRPVQRTTGSPGRRRTNAQRFKSLRCKSARMCKYIQRQIESASTQ